MNLLQGISYNVKGLKIGLKTPKLLTLGLIRFVAVLIVTIIAASLILVFHKEILGLIWAKPESMWFLWAWHILSWIIAFILIGLSTILSYLVTQVLFSVFIMDAMSRKTELMITGTVKQPQDTGILKQMFFLVKQETPRAIFPILLSLVIMVIGWFTPLGLLVTLVLSLATIVFLAWDNTDLTPARQMLPFKTRFGFLSRNLMFHIGFGLWFLIPVLNILFLSFAPIGATLYYLDTNRKTRS